MLKSLFFIRAFLCLRRFLFTRILHWRQGYFDFSHGSHSFFQPMPPFNHDTVIGASLATHWKTWLSDLNTFLIASGVTDPKQQCALLIYQAGTRVREVFSQLSDSGEEKDFTKAAALTEYFEPQKHRQYKVFHFRQAKQETGESLDQYHTRLRTLEQPASFML